MFSRDAIEQPGDLAGLNFRAVPTRVSTGFLNAMERMPYRWATPTW
jgi:hypothetical protein